MLSYFNITIIFTHILPHGRSVGLSGLRYAQLHQTSFPPFLAHTCTVVRVFVEKQVSLLTPSLPHSWALTSFEVAFLQSRSRSSISPSVTGLDHGVLLRRSGRGKIGSRPSVGTSSDPGLLSSPSRNPPPSVQAWRGQQVALCTAFKDSAGGASSLICLEHSSSEVLRTSTSRCGPVVPVDSHSSSLLPLLFIVRYAHSVPGGVSFFDPLPRLRLGRSTGKSKIFLDFE